MDGQGEALAGAMDAGQTQGGGSAPADAAAMEIAAAAAETEVVPDDEPMDGLAALPDEPLVG